MLTSTYTLVALSVEQTSLRAALHSLAEAVVALPDTLSVAPACAARLCERLRAVVDGCHWRKLDKFLIPVLRRRDAAIDALLQELEALSGAAAEAMRTVEACVAAAPVERAAFSQAVERCIGALRQRLEREEDELFPLARSVVGGEAWFAIANQMLAHDAYAKEKRAEGAAGSLRPPASGFDARQYDPQLSLPLASDALRRHTGLSISGLSIAH